MRSSNMDSENPEMLSERPIIQHPPEWRYRIWIRDGRKRYAPDVDKDVHDLHQKITKAIVEGTMDQLSDLHRELAVMLKDHRKSEQALNKYCGLVLVVVVLALLVLAYIRIKMIVQ